MADLTLESDLPWIEIPGGTKIVFTAISPTTGAEITGVTVSNIVVYGERVAGGLVERKVPLLSPEQVAGLG